MRSTAEIKFRLRQEAANALLLLRPPSFPTDAAPPLRLPFLPDPEGVSAALAGAAFRDRVRSVAERILAHRFPILGFELDAGPEIHWRRDALSGIESALNYFRRIPYLDAARAGDHKVIWELNRHQHLVVLAQEFRFSGELRFLDEIIAEVTAWQHDNPFQRGINWASALEVAFRALSWMWVWHLVSGAMPPGFRRRFATGLYRHGLHLESNLSVYFSPNTHLLGEALALYALGRMFSGAPRANHWRERGGAIVREQLLRQVRDDGSHFEQSAYYHVYATDMFLFYAVLAEPDEEYRRRLERMAVYLDALAGPRAALPSIGDDDGGRFFDPYSDRRDYAAETLAACGVYFNRPEWIRDARDTEAIAAWWFGPDALAFKPARAQAVETRVFPDVGVVVFAAGENHAVFDAGPLGPGSGGHSHADTLSLVARRGGEEILIDPGTYTYVGDASWRDRFRGSAMHNTVRIDQVSQAQPASPFSWRTAPQVRLLEFATGAERDVATGQCAYGGFTHRRRVIFVKPDLFFIVDDIEGPPGDHEVEQFWHAGAPVAQLSPASFRIGARATLTFEPGAAASVAQGGDYGWRSPVFGIKEESPVVILRRKTALPARLAVVLDLSGARSATGFGLSTDIEASLLGSSEPV